MEDYKLPSIPDLIEKLRPTAHTDALASLRSLRLNALFVYFQYSVAAVRLQEASIKAMEGGQDKNFSTHDEYEDCLLKLYSSAINAYSNLRTCLHFTRGLVEDIPKDATGLTKLEAYRESHAAWARDLIDRRDRIAAHPSQRDALVWKPNMWCDDGRVGFAVRNVDDPSQGRKIILHPRNDLERLRSYLSGLAPLMSVTFGLAQATVSMLPTGVQNAG